MRQVNAQSFSSSIMAGNDVEESDSESEPEVVPEREVQRKTNRNFLHAEPLWRFAHVSSRPASHRSTGVNTATRTGRGTGKYQKGTTKRMGPTSKREVQRSLLAYAKLGA